jgi:hypothetical protein
MDLYLYTDEDGNWKLFQGGIQIAGGTINDNPIHSVIQTDK